MVDIWERLACIYNETGEELVELGSDQTSCHDIKGGGYLPVGLTVEEGKKLIAANPDQFLEKVQDTLRRHVAAINLLSQGGKLYFWDYGNAFLLEAGRAGADVFKDETKTNFKYPSYVQDIMGDIFSLGFGPYRWICTSGNESDLLYCDKLATDVLTNIINSGIRNITSIK